jgi:4-carboxymuconolactone decarboxylase
VPARDRELVIHRTTARCRAEYEWGVHAAAFGRPLGLGEEVLRATVEGDARDPAFDSRQAALVRLCDELHDSSSLGDETWERLRDHFDELGLYHAVSFLANGLRLENEAFAVRFADVATRR